MPGTLFSQFDLTAASDESDGDGGVIDFALLSEMFCRREEDIRDEEEKKKAAKIKQVSESSKTRTVLEIKQINDIAMAKASLRLSAADVVDALSIVEDFSLSAEQVQKLALIVPRPEQEKLLEDNRASAAELSKEEQYLLDIMRLPGLQGHLNCLEVKFNFSDQFLILNSNLQSISKAVQGVEDNPELRQVFLILLKIGNYLNQGTGKGNALSFNLELLSNLKNSKAVGASHSKSSNFNAL